MLRFSSSSSSASGTFSLRSARHTPHNTEKAWEKEATTSCCAPHHLGRAEGAPSRATRSLWNVLIRSMRSTTVRQACPFCNLMLVFSRRVIGM